MQKRFNNDFAKLIKASHAYQDDPSSLKNNFYLDEDSYEKNPKNYNIYLRGTVGTPHQGSFLKLNVAIPGDYPYVAPNITLDPSCKIYHPNFSDGEICIDILQDQWSPALFMDTVMVSLSSLLSEPNPDSPLDSSAANSYVSDRSRYNRLAVDAAMKCPARDPSYPFMIDIQQKPVKKPVGKSKKTTKMIDEDEDEDRYLKKSSKKCESDSENEKPKKKNSKKYDSDSEDSEDSDVSMEKKPKKSPGVYVDTAASDSDEDALEITQKSSVRDDYSCDDSC